MARLNKLLVRMTDKEKASIAAAAELTGTSMSAWVREKLRAAAARELRKSDRDFPFLNISGRSQ